MVENIEELVDKTLIDKKELGDNKRRVKSPYTENLEKVKDNLHFYNKIQEKPVVSKDFDKTIWGETVNFNHYIEGQAWPSSFYNIDKLIRLNTSAAFEWMKRWLSKKRHVPLDMLWFLLIIIIIVVGIIAVWIILPKFM